MAYLVLAASTFALHVAFVAFVVAGGLLVRRRPKLAVVHLPAVAWAAYVSLANQVCPLTPLENWFLERAGAAGYEGGFLEHYVVPVLYPGDLTPWVQRLLGIGVVFVNLIAYGWALAGRREGR
jgi:hypothetical protein